MVDEKHDPGARDQDMDEIDQAIEDDIRKLKRSSNILILLCMVVVIVLVLVVGYHLYSYMLNNQMTSTDRFSDYIFVKSDDTVVYAQPDTTSAVLARLIKGEALFVIKSKDKWVQIEKRTIKGWVQSSNLAKKDEWPSRPMGSNVPIRFIDVNWIVDEIDNFTIIGKIENLSDFPLRNIKIQVNFYDREEACCDANGRDHAPVMSSETWVSREKPLATGVERKFIITGKYETNFKKIRYRIVSYE